jgi:hypothetical protein
LVQGTAISTALELQQIRNNLSGNFYLTNDIDASETSIWNGGAGFEPIDGFIGTLDGNGYTISGLTINRTGSELGLFGDMGTGGDLGIAIANLTLDSCSITCSGGSSVGKIAVLVGTMTGEGILIQNCHVTNSTVTITSDSVRFQIAGLIGDVNGGTVPAFEHIYIRDCTADITIDASTSTDRTFTDIGGLIGYAGDATITNCRSSGTINVATNNGVDGGKEVGGLVGYLDGIATTSNNVTDCSTTVSVTGGRECGGFVGTAAGATIARCSARGDVVGFKNCGGFISNRFSSTTITDCYSWGDVSATDTVLGYAGGFIQIDDNPGADDITNCYSVGAVSADTGVGGFLQFDDSALGRYVSCFWDTETSGTITSDGGTGHTTAWLQTRGNFESAGWDFDTVWQIAVPILWQDYWKYNSFGLGVNSVSVIPSTNEDEVWITVVRLIGDTIVYHLEQFQPRNFRNQEDAWFVDSGLQYDSTATSSISGLDHLEGEEVAILADGAVQSRKTVTNGAITLDSPASKVTVGLPFRYKLKPMRLDLTFGAGTTKGSIKNMAEVAIDFYETLNTKYGVDVNNLFDIDFRTTEVHGSPPSFFTGEKILSTEGGFDPEDSILVTGDDPLPCTIRSMVPRVEVTGR